MCDDADVDKLFLALEMKRDLKAASTLGNMAATIGFPALIRIVAIACEEKAPEVHSALDAAHRALYGEGIKEHYEPSDNGGISERYGPANQ